MKTIKKLTGLVLALVMIVSVCTIITFADDVSVPDPIAWYDFEDEFDFGKDKMGKHDLTCEQGNGEPKYASEGAVGHAIRFDGDYVFSSPSDNDLTDEIAGKSFTISYYSIREDAIADHRPWETPVAVDSFRIMHRIDAASKDLIHVIYYPKEDDWWNFVYYPDNSIGVNLNLYTISVEVGGGKTVSSYYFNDQFVESKTFDYELNVAKDNLTFAIGSQANGDGWYYFDGGCFTGVVDEVRLWDVALSAEQIAAIFESENPDGTMKDYDTVFGIHFEIPDDSETETEEETEPAAPITNKPESENKTTQKPVETDKPSTGENKGLSPAVIAVIAVAAVLVVVAVVVGIIAAKKKNK